MSDSSSLGLLSASPRETQTPEAEPLVSASRSSRCKSAVELLPPVRTISSSDRNF